MICCKNIPHSGKVEASWLHPFDLICYLNSFQSDLMLRVTDRDTLFFFQLIKIFQCLFQPLISSRIFWLQRYKRTTIHGGGEVRKISTRQQWKYKTVEGTFLWFGLVTKNFYIVKLRLGITFCNKTTHFFCYNVWQRRRHD